MIGKLLIAFFALVTGVAIGLFLPGTGSTPKIENPERPAGVPSSAKWAGGLDGGAWVDCNENQGHLIACRIYANVTGVLMEEGEFSVAMESVRPTFYSAGLIDTSVRLKRVIPD